MASSLESILSDEKPTPPPPAEAPPAVEPAAPKEPAKAAEPPKEPAAGQPRASDGTFAPKSEAPKAPPAAPPPPPQDMTEKEKAAFAKAADETRKRQAAEARVAELTAKLSPPKEPEKPKAFWDDPEAALKRHQDEVRTETTNARLNTAELIARSRYTDFDEKVAEFSELVRTTPGLAAQWLAAPDPAEFAYVTGKNHILLKQSGGFDAALKKARDEAAAAERVKVEAEFKARHEALEKERAALPPSLTETRGAGGAGTRPAWTGPTPLADILK